MNDKYDNGTWYSRTSPDGKWIAMGKHQLAEKLYSSQFELEAYKQALREGCAANWSAQDVGQRLAELLGISASDT